MSGTYDRNSECLPESQRGTVTMITRAELANGEPDWSSLKKHMDAEESLECKQIENHFGHLAAYTFEFFSALQLFNETMHTLNNMELSDRLLVYTAWTRIAARDGAFTIYHFGMTVDALNKHLPRVPILFNAISKADLKTANRRFSKAFPSFESIRNAIGHQAELRKNSRKRELNSAGGVLASDNIKGNIYSASYKGRMLQYELNDTALTSLRETLDLFRLAISNVNPSSLSPTGPRPD